MKDDMTGYEHLCGLVFQPFFLGLCPEPVLANRRLRLKTSRFLVRKSSG
eukprot:COSAG06_NODE_35781_length_455_cov_2.415730_1_plen_48_part_10